MWKVLVSLMEVQESTSGLLLLPLMKLVLTFLVTVPVITLIKQEVPQLLQHSWGTITSVIQPVKAFFRNGFFYGGDPLWDGAGCGPLNTCCTFNNPPWFYKELPAPTTDDIEMRVCKDQQVMMKILPLRRLISMYSN